MSDILNKGSYELFKEVTNKTDDDVILMMLNSTLFIHPDVVKLKPVMFPDAARESNEFHKGIKRAQKSTWEGREINIYDNQKARTAFGQYAKLRMGGKNRNVPKGLHVAHIWERVYDPSFFTAGWNICLMPDFLKIYTEKQSGTDVIAAYLRQAGFDIYFKSEIIDRPNNLEDPGLDIKSKFPNWIPSFTSNN